MKFQKRAAASLLKCGKRKIWIDPNEKKEILLIDSRSSIKKFIKDGFIVKKNNCLHSRNRIRLRHEAIFKGRSSGTGKKKGSSNARSSKKNGWIFKQRVLRHLLKKYRKMSKIDNHLYRELYKKCKGNVFKNKRILIEYLRKANTEASRKRSLTEKFETRRNKQKILKDRKLLKFNQKIKGLQNELA
nr:60S ribosomal protein L19 [Cryptomonas curvata]